MQPARGGANPTLTFFGAAQTVTGSMHLVEAGGERILLDCGIARLGGKRRGRVDVDFPFVPGSLDAVVLSHAHIDHCGNLVHLVRQGYDGPIYCTAATRDLTAIMLGDSARIQDEEDQFLRTLRNEPDGRHTPTARSWVSQTIGQCVPVPYDHRVQITRQASLRFADAGHLLGSAMTSLTLPGATRDVTLTFTGDLGRRGLPFLRDAAPVPAGDVLVCESTYGARFHQDADSMAEAMARVVNRSADEGGVVLIPAFSLGRTQLVLHYLCRWKADGLLPDLPVFVDSPLAIDIGAVHARYPECFSRPPLGGDDDVTFIHGLEESDKLEGRRGPYILVASGGMCDGGRISKHLRQHIDDPRASLVLVSYQAPESLGRKLLEKGATVWFHGKRWNKWLEVVELNGFSGHADQADLLACLTPLAANTGKVRLVHGEPEAAGVLAGVLRHNGFDDVGVPARGETVTIEN